MENKSINIFKKIIFIVLPLLILITITCVKKPSNPASIEPDDFPVAPTNFQALVGDKAIVLTWSHPNVEDIEIYKIFRQDSTGGEFNNIGSSNELAYKDSNLQNNREYSYQVSAVGKNGLEGNPSTIIKAVSAVYVVSINSDQELTNSRTVTLSFTAPVTTTLVKVSNDSLITGAQWENFVPARNWTLSVGDGMKTVYVKFRDIEDRETFKPSTDNIILDTEAIIRRVTENSGGRVLTSSDSIHFAVVTEESSGNAWVNLQRFENGITLFDDGTNGDSIANDGIYEVDYQIPTGPEVEDALVTGHFVDRAGNATSLNTSSRLTIRTSPRPVTLIQVAPFLGASTTALNLFWTRNSDSDFASYRIFRSGTSGVDTESPLLTIIQDQSTITYTDSTLASNRTYYYRVYAFDTTGLFSGSNEKSGTTNSN